MLCWVRLEGGNGIIRLDLSWLDLADQN